MSGLNVRYFPHIYPHELLYVLPEKPIERLHKSIVELPKLSYTVWLAIQAVTQHLPHAMKLFNA